MHGGSHSRIVVGAKGNNMREMVFLLLLVLVPSPASAEDEQDRDPQLERRLKELERQNAALRKRVAELESFVAKLAERAGRPPTVQDIVRFEEEPRSADHLRGIELPETPSKYQVRLYVAKILRAAVRHRNAFGDRDPEVRLLKKVGPAHVDVLLEPLLYEGLDTYLIVALKSLVGEEHKDLILESLPIVRELIEVVLIRKWTDEAAPTLLKVLADRDSWAREILPTEWIEAVAELKRPESYEDLKAYFCYGDNRYITWKAIRGLPGMELKPEVEKLWQWAKKVDHPWVRTDLAAVAAHYGHLDALEVLFEEPDNWPQSEVIERVTPYRGQWEPAEKAKKWFAAHKNRLVFDVSKGKYRLLGERKAPEDQGD